MGRLLEEDKEKKVAPPWTDFRVLTKAKFDLMARALVKAREEKKSVEGQIRSLQEKMEPLFEALPDDVRSVQVEEIKCTLVSSRSPSKIEANKLLVLGVKASVIAEATVEGKPYSYINTTVPKEKDEG